MMRREWFQLRFERAGTKGKILSVPADAKRVFVPDKVMATDSRGGASTRIVAVYVGGKAVFTGRDSRGRLRDAVDLAPLSSEFTMEMLRASLIEQDGRRFLDTHLQPVIFQVEFLEDCTWLALFEGDSLVPVGPAPEPEPAGIGGPDFLSVAGADGAQWLALPFVRVDEYLSGERWTRWLYYVAAAPLLEQIGSRP